MRFLQRIRFYLADLYYLKLSDKQRATHFSELLDFLINQSWIDF